MNDPQKVPLLLEFLFGDTAAMVLRTAPPRLLAWCHGFESWILELERTHHPRESRKSIFVWRAFLEKCARLPWEVTQDDVKAYVKERESAGKAHNTIRHDLIKLSQFYEWMARTRGDPSTSQDFNPAAALRRPKRKVPTQAQVLSRAEAQALLDAFLRQGSVLSLRDHAYVKLRLCLGRHNCELDSLRWGQFEIRGDGPWVRWNDGGDDLLEYDAYAALLHYLRKSGRLEGMSAESYVFVPLKHGGVGGEKPEDWNETLPIGDWTPLYNLKRFGGLVGIPPEKLTVQTLRNTAISRRVEAGASVEGIQAFMGGGRLYDVRAYINKLPVVAERPLDPGVLEDAGAISRGSHHFALGEGLTHGDQAKRQPPDEVAAILAENVEGLKDELRMMRLLQRRLLYLASDAQTDQEQEILHEAASMIGGRISTMRKIDRLLAKLRKMDDPLADLQTFENWCAERDGRPPKKISLHSDDEGDPWAGLEEEIASSRLVARKAYALAMESDDPRSAACNAEVFGRRCIRMAGQEQLKIAQREDEQEQFREIVDIALDQIMVEKNIHL